MSDVDSYDADDYGTWFFVEGNPVGQARARASTGPKGRIRFYTPKKSADWKQAAIREIRFMRLCDTPHTGPVWLRVIAIFQASKSRLKNKKRSYLNQHLQRPDLDNVVKAVMDAGNGLLWVDDAQVWKILAEKQWSSVRPELGAAAKEKPGVYFQVITGPDRTK